MRRLLLPCALAAALAACAEAPRPQPLPVATGPGTWRVSARAPTAGTARLRGLRKAAELTLAQGGDWFRVRGGDVAHPNSSGPHMGAFDDLGSPYAERRSGLTLDIQVGHGPRPAGEDVYDARAVASHLGGAPPLTPRRGPAGAQV